MLDQLEEWRSRAYDAPGIETLTNALDDNRRTIDYLVSRLADVQEEQLRSIANALHDQLGQSIAALNVELNALQNDQSVSRDTLAASFTNGLSKLARELRGCVQTLYPFELERLGLAAALKTDLPKRLGGARINLLIKIDDSLILQRKVELQIYRVAQEAVTNVIKHAKATDVKVELARIDGIVTLVVVDNGVGFEVTEHMRSGFGITGMQDRCASVAGSLRVVSARGGGTMIEASFGVDQIVDR